MSTNISMSKQISQALPLNYFGMIPDGDAKHPKYLKIIWICLFSFLQLLTSLEPNEQQQIHSGVYNYFKYKKTLKSSPK